MSFLNNVYTAEPVRTPGARITTANEEFDIVKDPTTPEVVAGYVRLALTVIGTLTSIIPGLEVAGVPVTEWLASIFGATCG